MNKRTRKSISQTLPEYEAEVLRLLLDHGLTESYAQELIEADRPYLTQMFQEGGPEQETAKEIIPVEHPAHEKPMLASMTVSVCPQVTGYMEQLVVLGMFGPTVEDVATELINRQLIDLMSSGLVVRSEQYNSSRGHACQ